MSSVWVSKIDRNLRIGINLCINVDDMAPMDFVQIPEIHSPGFHDPSTGTYAKAVAYYLTCLLLAWTL